MNLVFDTSTLIELDRGNADVIKRVADLRKHYPAPAKISFMTYFEFLFGLRNKIEKNVMKSSEFIEKFTVIQTSKKTAKILVDLKHRYELPISDLFIAAQVQESDGVLVTRDNDFKMIEGITSVIV